MSLCWLCTVSVTVGMSRRNLWYDCMFITMRIVVLILPVLVCDDILTVGIVR